MMAMRPIQVSTDVYAAIWAARKTGEDSEDEILRRALGLPKSDKTSKPAPSSPPKIGYSDYRFGVEVSEGFPIFRTYKGTEYRATATDNKWLLKNTGKTYSTLNQLSRAVAGIENAWEAWYFLDENGQRQLVDKLRRPATSGPAVRRF